MGSRRKKSRLARPTLKSFGRLKRRVRVVIADDVPLLLDRIVRLIELHFDVVGRAGNGRELVQAVQNLSPAVVVADIMMPEVNGIEATRFIAKNFPRVKVVALSASDDPAIITAVLDAGASGYVSKLTADTDLVLAVERVLAGGFFRSSLGEATTTKKKKSGRR